MEKGDLFLAIIIIALVVALVSVISYSAIVFVEPSCHNDCECKCEELGMEFLRYDQTGFGSDECYCWDGNKSVRLW